MQDRGREICVCCYEIRCSIAGDAWTADDEGDVDVFFVGAGFAWLEAVLTDVKPVVYFNDVFSCFSYLVLREVYFI